MMLNKIILKLSKSNLNKNILLGFYFRNFVDIIFEIF